MTTEQPIYEYRIFCLVENIFVTHYGPEPPTTCPHDTNHVVNPDSVQQLALVGPNLVVSKDGAPSKGHFQLRTIKMELPPSAEGEVPVARVMTITFPYTIYIWEMTISNALINISDELTIGVGDDMPIGVLTDSVAAGATVIPVSPTVLGVIVRNSEIALINGATVEHPGIILEIDRVNSTVTVEKPLVNAFPTGSIVGYTQYVVKDFVFTNTEGLVMGRKGLQSKDIPANTPIRLTYLDRTPNPDPYTLCLQLQYYYE